MSQEQPTPIRFQIEESVWLDNHTDESRMLSLDLEPYVNVRENEGLVHIDGYIVLTGRFQTDPGSDHSLDVDTGSLADQLDLQPLSVDQKEIYDRDTKGKIEKKFPLDVTVPAEKVRNVADVMVDIEEFDYTLEEGQRLNIIADIVLHGVENGLKVDNTAHPSQEEVTRFAQDMTQAEFDQGVPERETMDQDAVEQESVDQEAEDQESIEQDSGHQAFEQEKAFEEQETTEQLHTEQGSSMQASSSQDEQKKPWMSPTFEVSAFKEDISRVEGHEQDDRNLQDQHEQQNAQEDQQKAVRQDHQSNQDQKEPLQEEQKEVQRTLRDKQDDQGEKSYQEDQHNEDKHLKVEQQDSDQSTGQEESQVAKQSVDQPTGQVEAQTEDQREIENGKQVESRKSEQDSSEHDEHEAAEKGEQESHEHDEQEVSENDEQEETVNRNQERQEDEKTEEDEKVIDLFETHIRPKSNIAAAEEEEAAAEGEEDDGEAASKTASFLHELLSDEGEEERESYIKLKMCIVQENESLQDISERYAVSTSDIIRANQLDSEHIASGQILRIPGTD